MTALTLNIDPRLRARLAWATRDAGTPEASWCRDVLAAADRAERAYQTELRRLGEELKAQRAEEKMRRGAP